MEFVRNMERRCLIKPQDILATLQSIPEDESESELQEHVFDSDSDEDFIPQNISSESEDSEGTNPEDIPSTSTGDRAHAVMLPRDHPPGRGQKKSAKRPRNERTTDNDGGEGNATTNTREGESEGILVSADGIQWKPVEIGEHLPGRRDSQNILREAPGPTGYARRNIIIDSTLSAWRLFFDSYILTHIKNCTLAEACRNNNLQFTLSDEELDAFIAIFYARGISGTNRHSISSIWCNDWGIPFCKATMSRDRFVEIMRFLRFDEKSTRSERLQTDKFALFSTVWDRFIENCIACYKPGPYITVDEQLFPSKTRCPFTQYMPSKPDKYGHKYWLAFDKRSKYLANGFPYLGKDDTRRAEDRLADHVVMKLLDPFLKKGRNVTTDNYFTSVKLAKQLKSKGTTIVGTLNKIRREVPKEIKSMKEELYNTKVFRNEDNFTLTVYQGKPNKNVVILSSVHPDVVVASDSAKKTPETVKFYNETKYGVDVVDQMARKYTTRTCTRRWPVHAFENALDFAGINAWIIFKEITHQKMSRKAFLQTLVRELSGPYVTDREKGSTSQVSTCSEVMVQTKFCQIKEKCKKNRSVGNCKTCGKSLCGQCTAINQSYHICSTHKAFYQAKKGNITNLHVIWLNLKIIRPTTLVQHPQLMLHHQTLKHQTLREEIEIGEDSHVVEADHSRPDGKEGTGQDRALNKLENNKQLIIKASDKGGNLVLLDHSKYLSLCQRILNDKDTYEVLLKNPTIAYTSKLINILEEGKAKFLYLKPEVPTIPTFYALPKVHKGLNPLKGRPTVAGIDSLSQNIVIYIDKVLRPFVIPLPSYVRDTLHLLTQLEGVAVEETTYLASIDVEALNSSIPHEAGIQVVGHFLKMRAVECYDHNRLVEDLLRFTLTHNYFLFNDKTHKDSVNVREY
ncbi:uncharacterized protein [Phyllobates terribilis]|uniref:uncharacterized protein n=1 Tax=Phyllobates terribilis TaxID=111132 RepID=UPI003CCA7956